MAQATVFDTLRRMSKLFKWCLKKIDCHHTCHEIDLMRFLKYVSLLVCGALALGAIYQWRAESADKALIPGELVSVGEHEFHLLCEGNGSPLILLENGLWGSYPDWFYVIEGIRSTTKVCAYDRLGMGWSSKNDKPTRASDVADYLHELRQAADIHEPMILVGFSAGGLYVREYQKRYPEDVVGMLLIDSAHEQQAFRIEHISKDLSLERLCSAIAWTGIARLLGLFDDFPEKSFSAQQHEEQLRAYHRSGFCSGLVQQYQGFEEDLFADTLPQDMGDLPLTVVSAGKTLREQVLNDAVSDDFLSEHEREWPELQKGLAGLSSQSTHIIAQGSGHAVQLEKPQVVIEALKKLVADTLQ